MRNSPIHAEPKHWKPVTTDEWLAAYQQYWDCLITETRKWEEDIRRDANSTILESAGEQLRVGPKKEAVLSVIEQIAADPATDRRKLHRFIIHRIGLFRDKEDHYVYHRLRRLNGRLARQSLESRFQRYVLDTTWDELQDINLEPEDWENTRPSKLLRALAGRVARNDEPFEQLLQLLVANTSETGALFAFGQALCAADEEYRRLVPLLSKWEDPVRSQCLRGYFNCLRARSPELWQGALLRLLNHSETACQGAELVWGSGFNDEVFDSFLSAFENGWIKVGYLGQLSYGKAWKTVAPEKLNRLFAHLAKYTDKAAAQVMIELLDRVSKDGIWPVDTGFIFEVITNQAHFQDKLDTMHGYHWQNICKRLVARDPQMAMPLLEVLLQQMGEKYRLSYDRHIEPLAADLCRRKPDEAWEIVATHLLGSAPKWRFDLLHWLKGGVGGFGEDSTLPPIAAFPVDKVIDWIAEDPECRASMIAHCVPGSLEDEDGGIITRFLLANHSGRDSVTSSISASFYSGGWSGLESQYLRNKRSLLRSWLTRGFEPEVISWIEDEISHFDRRIEVAEISEERERWTRP